MRAVKKLKINPPDVIKHVGKGEAAARRSWMEAEGDKVEADV